MENSEPEFKKSSGDVIEGNKSKVLAYPTFVYREPPSIIRQENFTNFTCDKCGGSGLVSTYVEKCINRNRKNANVKRRYIKNNVIFKTHREERNENK
jgi:hypothetical protein